MKYPIKIEELEAWADYYNVSLISRVVLRNSKFSSWSACAHSTGHHYGTGGLQYHTWEVVKLCLNNSSFLANQGLGPKIDQRTLFLAALFHDIGKIYDYQRVVDPKNLDSDIWTGTEHKRVIHHISRSAIIWSKAVSETDTCCDIEDSVLHCILSHHGQREWGSPVAPKSREAWLLHLCDGISARSADCDTIDLIKTK